jgi:hypothetical protein
MARTKTAATAGKARQGGAGQAWHGAASRGVARLGAAGMEVAGNGGAAPPPVADIEDLRDLRGRIPPPPAPGLRAEKVVIAAPRMEVAALSIVGTSPYCQHKFSLKAQLQMEATQRAGTQARSRKTREARDFEANFLAAQHRSTEGWAGIPAPAFRNACIDACRLVNFKMTHAKLSLFVEADGRDEQGMPLVKIIGAPRIHKSYARNANGVADLRWRPMWDEWRAIVNLFWDADQFSTVDVFNLMSRAGIQVGIGEGRPGSPNSNGLGWGCFRIEP